jgi:predicted ABC-type ATPase
MIPRLRMIAGPNGSGKSTLAQQLTDDYAINLYKFLNADILFAEIAKSYKTACPFNIDNQDLLDFINNSTYPDDCKTPFRNHLITIDEEDCFVFDPCAINSYTVAMVADFLKDQYLKRHLSFSFETVFSHPAKIEILKKAQAEEFKTYMYFVATESPFINIKRIQQRVENGGHNVPADKTIARYYRCLEQINQVLPYLNRAYFFDNTDNQLVFFSEYEKDKGFILFSELIPEWFRHFVFGE